MRYGPTQEDEAHSGKKIKMADGLTVPICESSTVKPTLPMGVITSQLIVSSAQDLYQQRPLAHAPCLTTPQITSPADSGFHLCDLGYVPTTYRSDEYLEFQMHQNFYQKFNIEI
ncbi:hypothetical protein ElyMa_001950800 [Elysia marginata]|uniref:Uncharacterized protein n=1 Tax=Elysia marginata TaxID=1093978 RepID=A0AAV4EXD2_9GAST|nr:hypothetical protein ElyMa_001950800 [Elysia marginata]